MQVISILGGLDYSSNEFWKAAGGDDRHVAAPAGLGLRP